MKRLLMLMMMVVVGAVVVRTQQEPIPNTIGGVENGLTWKSSSYSVKLAFVDGARAGVIMGVYAVLCPQECHGNVNAAMPAWFKNDASAADIVKEMDAFYEEKGKINFSMDDAFVVSNMKLAGATKRQLESYRRRAFRVSH